MTGKGEHLPVAFVMGDKVGLRLEEDPDGKVILFGVAKDAVMTPAIVARFINAAVKRGVLRRDRECLCHTLPNLRCVGVKHERIEPGKPITITYHFEETRPGLEVEQMLRFTGWTTRPERTLEYTVEGLDRAYGGAAEAGAIDDECIDPQKEAEAEAAQLTKYRNARSFLAVVKEMAAGVEPVEPVTPEIRHPADAQNQATLAERF